MSERERTPCEWFSEYGTISTTCGHQLEDIKDGGWPHCPWCGKPIEFERFEERDDDEADDE